MTKEKQNDSQNPTALVIGAGAPRIGNCVARTLSARGYRVALHANRSIAGAEATARELAQDGPEAFAIAGDASDEGAVQQMVDAVVQRWGSLDALVNCAAIWQPKRLEEVTAADVRRHFEVNALGTFLCARAAGLIMVGQTRGGAIVNVGDWATIRPYRDYAAYFVSKGSIPTITRTLAVELASRNSSVRVNAVLPGPVMLPDEMLPEEREAVIRQTLVRREGTPEHLADAVVFLLENDFITGVCLPVDGGRSVYAD